jgi:hypothetical protein
MQPMTIRPTKDGRKKIYIKPPQAYLKKRAQLTSAELRITSGKTAACHNVR